MQGRKPTRTEWKIFEQNGLNSKEWLVQKATISYLQIVNKKTGKETVIHTHGNY